MLDKIIPKLLREYMDTDDPARRAELVQVLQDYGAFPRIFEVCDKALSADGPAYEEDEEGEPAGLADEEPATTTRRTAKRARGPVLGTSSHFAMTVD